MARRPAGTKAEFLAYRSGDDERGAAVGVLFEGRRPEL